MNPFILISFILSISSVVYAQQVDSSIIEIGRTLTIHSSILNQERKINIYLPNSYPAANVTYPVLYVLDAGTLFVPSVAAVQFINYGSYVGQMPEAIVVGIINKNRDADMPVPQIFLHSAGPSQFLAFLSDELVPFINSRYPANGLNILIGHSQGALFATYAGVEKPNMFKGVIALDIPVTVVPEVMKSLRQKMEEHSPQKYYSAESLYGWGNESRGLIGHSGFKQMKMEGETHETMPFKGIYDGLRFLFQDHLSTQNNLTLKNIQEYYENLSRQWSCHYSVPKKVLLNQAIPMMLGRSKKQDAIELITYYEQVYGADESSREAMKQADTISSGPDDRIDYYLGLSTPSEESIKRFTGKWTGKLIVPGGMDMDIEWVIKKNNGGFIMEMTMMNSFVITNDFLLSRGTNELQWGRKHQSGGVYLSTAILSADGQVLEGEEDLIGHQRAAGEPSFIKNRFRFVRKK